MSRLPIRRPATTALRWRLLLLGVPGVQRGDRPQGGAKPEPLERRAAALLAYLALEGPTPRSKLAGLLWPESTEAAARANLRQRLKRLRESLGTELVVPDEPLRLQPDVEVDATEFESLAFIGEYAAALERGGTLLAGQDYDDAPDLEAWVLAARVRLENVRRNALNTLADRAEQGGEYALALKYTERLLVLDPVSEELHGRVMRLHHLAGDRVAALRAFERCREMLRRELGVEPLPGTLALLEAIATGAQVQGRPPRSLTGQNRVSIPVGVLRPPVLAGRERQWARLEAAWEAGQVMFICGPAGSGKTRLMTDFAASRGEVWRLGGRPGDAGVPYSTHARSLRHVLASPEPAWFRSNTLEPWVRRELSRLVPELEPEASAPIRDEAEKLRFFQAAAHLVQTSAQHPVANRRLASIVFDDLHFMDAGSFEIGAFIAARSVEGGRADTPGDPGSSAHPWPRSLNAFRTGELPPEVQARIEELVDTGVALLIELEPLGTEAVQVMLDGIGLPETSLSSLAPALERYTGGNPLFIVETLKHLIETGQLDRKFPARLPPPGKVGPLIRRRLERLTPAALRLAQVAAVSEGEFDLNLGAHVLECAALDLIPAVGELEAAQVMRGEAFTHDLLLEATLTGLPGTILRLLHRRAAQYLEELNLKQTDSDRLEGAPPELRPAPARMAHHWLEAGDQARAVPHLRAAALASAAAYRFSEAIAFNLHAADLLLALGQQPQAFERVQASQNWAQTMGSSAQTEALLARLESMALTPVQHGYVQLGRANVLFDRGETEAAEQLVRAAWQGTDGLADDPALGGELAGLLGVILWAQGQYDGCAALFEEAARLNEACGDMVNVTVNLTNLAALQSTLLQHRQAISSFGRALETLETRDDLVVRTGLLTNLGAAQLQMGQGSASHQTLRRSAALLETMPDVLERQLVCLYQLGMCSLQLGDYRAAQTCCERVLELAPATDAHVRPGAQRTRALVALGCGQIDVAEGWLAQAMSAGQLRPDAQVAGLIIRNLIAARRGQNPHDWLDAAQALDVGQPLARILLRLWRSMLLPAAQAHPLALEMLEVAQLSELYGAQIMAHTRLSQILLRPGDGSDIPGALDHAASAARLLGEYDALPLGFQRAEVLLAHYRALSAHRRPDAGAALEQALGWVTQSADVRVADGSRQSFLEGNPLNAEILEAARAAGLKLPG